jgi:hypothetical protein
LYDSELSENFAPCVIFPLGAFAGIEFVLGFSILIERWQGNVGTIAYIVTDLNGCTPFNGTAYLQQGARSRAFRIIQTCEWVFTILGLAAAFIASCTIARHDDDAWHVKTLVWAGLSSILYVPEIIYEGIIAGKGTPVVISGNCMLVELNPRWGIRKLRTGGKRWQL